MIRRHLRAVVSLSALAISLAACASTDQSGVGIEGVGSEAAADPTEVPVEPTLGQLVSGGCEPINHATTEISPLGGLVASTSWLETTVAALEPNGEGNDSNGYAMVDLPEQAIKLSGAVVPGFKVKVSTFPLLDKVDGSIPVLVGVSSTGFASVLALLPRDAPDEVVFAQDCYGYNDGFTEFAEFVGESPVALIRSIASGTDPTDALADFLTADQPLAWIDRDAGERQIDPAETPASVFDALDGVVLVLDVPDSWKAASIQLCSRVAMGWNQCGSFGADVSEIPEAEQGWTLNAWYSPGTGEDLEFWMFDTGSSPFDGGGWYLGSVSTAGFKDDYRVSISTRVEFGDLGLDTAPIGSTVDAQITATLGGPIAGS
jgi:hypothetical protein